jgi:hypothetical protein
MGTDGDGWMVAQDTPLFQNSIEYNIAYAATGI